MPNNIAVSITADVADLQAKRAILSAELKVATKDLNDFAKTANTSGLTDELRTGMLAASTDVAKVTNQLKLVNAEIKSLTETENRENSAKQSFLKALQDQAATQGLSTKQLAAYRAEQLGVTAEAAPFIESLKDIGGHAISSRASMEGLVLVHEALSGNYRRMAGSSMIMAQALAGAEGTTAALSAVMSPLGLIIGGTVAALGAATYAAVEYDHEQRNLIATSIGIGAAAGLTAGQLREAGEAAADWSGRSVRASTESAAAFASAGVKSQESISKLAGDVEVFAQLTGVEAADAQKELAQAMRDPVKGAEDLNQQLGIVDGTTMEHIRTLSAMGDKDAAVTLLVEALQQRMDDAKASGVGLSGEFATMSAELSNLCNWLGEATSRLLQFQQLGPAGVAMFDNAQAGADRTAAIAHMMGELNQASVGGAAVFNNTPEGKDQGRQEELVSGLARLRQALIADTALHGENSDAVQRDKQALSEYSRAIMTYLPEAEKAHKLATLEDQLAQARHGHNKALIDDIGHQIEMTKLAGQVMSPEEASQRAADAGRLNASRAGAGRKAHGPSIVSEWQEQLHAAEILSNDFFGDQTQRELQFWQSKVGLTRQGSKEWLEVQGKIYDAQKTLARQGYEQHLADLNDQIETDRNSWQLTKADWEIKLAFIKEKFGEQSTEYLNAHREFVRLEREHQDQMFQAQKDGENKQLEQLKSHLNAMRSIRQSDAGATEAAIRDKEQGNPLGEIEAARQVAQLRQQLSLQELNDLEVTYQRQDEILGEQIARAKNHYTEDSKQYQDAIASKLKADQDYADAKARLEQQANAQSIQSILAVKQAYHGYIDGMVSSTVSGLVGVAGYTQTWQQAITGVWNSLLGTISNVLTRMVSNWIVTHVFMTSAQRAQLAIQTAQHTAAEGVKTASTFAGNSVRVASSVVASGATSAVKSVETLHHSAAELVKTGASIAGNEMRVASTAIGATQTAAITGAHNLKEITSHAAAGAAAAYHAMAGIPVIGPVLGAAAAAVTFAAIEGFGAMASLAVGTNEVPVDMVAQIHAGERIIPAADNKALMAAINDNGRGPDRSAVGDTINQHSWEYHDHTGSAKPDRIYENRAALAKAFKQAHREGHFAGFRF